MGIAATGALPVRAEVWRAGEGSHEGCPYREGLKAAVSCRL